MRFLSLSRRAVSWSLSLLLLAACNHDISTPFPPGLEPLEDNRAPVPAPVDGDDTPEAVETLGESRGDLTVGMARGFIHAPIADVAAALADSAVAVDKTIADEASITPATDPDYPTSFAVHYTVHSVITVEWDIDWREGAEHDREGHLQGYRARYQKTYGTDFITTFEGSVELTPVSDTVTAYSMIERIDAHDQEVKDTVGDTVGLFSRLRDRVHGVTSH